MLTFFLSNPIGRALGGVISLVGLVLGFKVWLAANNHSVAETARQGYVLLAEKTAAQAKADEIQRQLDAANASLTSFRKRLDEEVKAADARDKERENEILGYELRRTHPRWAALSELSDLALTVLIDVNKDSAEWNGLRLSIAVGGDASAKR